MPVPRAKNMISMLETNDYVVTKQLEGLTDEDLMLQPAMRGNCANWVLGHIVDSRSNVIQRFKGERYWPDEKRNLYKFDSTPITDADCPHVEMAQLLEDYHATGKIILELLENVTDAELDADYNEKTTLGDSVHFLIWHESYHVGQLEYLRQLTGVNDKVI